MEESYFLDVVIFYVFADHINVQLEHDLVRSNNKAPMIYMNEIDSEFRFNTSERSVEISNVFTQGCHELISIAVTHRDNDLFL